MRIGFRTLAILTFGTLIWSAEAAPIPASAIGLAGASYGVELSGGVILGVFTLPDTILPTAIGSSATALPIGPTPSTDCAIASTSCVFGGIAGGAAIAVDGSATLVNFLGGYGFVLFFADDGSLTLTVLASDVSTTVELGAEPIGSAAADGIVAPPLFDDAPVFLTGVGETTTIAVTAGIHGLVWNGAGVVLAAARSLDAEVPEPTGFALAVLGGMLVLRRRTNRRA